MMSAERHPIRTHHARRLCNCKQKRPIKRHSKALEQADARLTGFQEVEQVHKLAVKAALQASPQTIDVPRHNPHTALAMPIKR
jgi:hypothetical protein